MVDETELRKFLKLNDIKFDDAQIVRLLPLADTVTDLQDVEYEDFKLDTDTQVVKTRFNKMLRILKKSDESSNTAGRHFDDGESKTVTETRAKRDELDANMSNLRKWCRNLTVKVIANNEKVESKVISEDESLSVKLENTNKFPVEFSHFLNVCGGSDAAVENPASLGLGYLLGMGETKAQENIDKMIDGNALLKAEATSAGGATHTFMPPTNVTFDDKKVAALTCTSKVEVLGARAKLELKSSVKKGPSDWSEDAAKNGTLEPKSRVMVNTCFEVLSQGIRRVAADAMMYGARTRIVSIAASDRGAWVLLFSRGNRGANFLYILPVAYKTVDTIWSFLHQQDNEFYYTEDAPTLLHALRTLELTETHTRIELQARSSQGQVYLVTPCQLVTHTNNQVCAVLCDKPAYAIKVIDDTEVFKAEIAALQKVHKEWSVSDIADKPEFYALGHCEHGKKMVWFDESDKNDWTQLHKQSQSAIDKLPTSSAVSQATSAFSNLRLDSKAAQGGEGGYVLMKVCKPVTLASLNDDDKERYFCDVSWWLDIVHEASVLHCDVRYPNIMQLGDRFVLIDFGMAAVLKEGETTATFEISQEDGQFKRSGLSVRSQAQEATEFNVVWSKSADYEMLLLLALSTK